MSTVTTPAWVHAAREADAERAVVDTHTRAWQEAERAYLDVENAKRTAALVEHYRHVQSAIGFVHEQVAPPEWTAAIREYSPVRDDRSWLELVWEPGDPWYPVQRWELYQMLHPSLVDISEVRCLQGPHPRSEGHMCSTHVPQQFQCLCPHKSETWRGGPNPDLTMTEWKLYQRTGYVGRRFWIIQGTKGGHRHVFSHTEQRLLERAGYPTDTPAPGSLAYAPYDGRVKERVQKHNLLYQFRNNIQDFKRAMGPGYAHHVAGQERELRMQLVEYLREMAVDVGEDFITAADHGEMQDTPFTNIDFDRLAEENESHFVETGQMLSVRTAMDP